jgi:hypothetical protein
LIPGHTPDTGFLIPAQSFRIVSLEQEPILRQQMLRALLNGFPSPPRDENKFPMFDGVPTPADNDSKIFVKYCFRLAAELPLKECRKSSLPSGRGFCIDFYDSL